MGSRTTEVIIVGAGILGLAHAWHLARRGVSVVVFERSPRATGASARNFGMVWPIGQSAGPLLEMALRSRGHWLELLNDAKLPYRANGSLHVAYRADEAEVIQEFAERAPAMGYSCAWLDREETLAHSQALQPDGLIGSLWSGTEITIDPRMVLWSLPAFLEERYGVRFQFNTPVLAVDNGQVDTPDGRWQAENVLICSGQDFETLFPAEFASSGITRCKLQMMRTVPQPAGWELGPSLAAGLTLRFYPSFNICDSLPALRQRIATESPELDKWAIHTLVSQAADGSLVLGDSHEYGLDVDIFNKEEIDTLILNCTRQFLKVPDLTIAQRWHGVYARHPEKPFVVMQPQPGTRIVTAPGGSGMTLSFGMAEQVLTDAGLLRGNPLA